MTGLEGTSISLSFKVGSGKKAKTNHVTLVRSNAFLGCYSHFHCYHFGCGLACKSGPSSTESNKNVVHACACVAGEDGNNKERQWKATRTDWIDPDAQAVEI